MKTKSKLKEGDKVRVYYMCGIVTKTFESEVAQIFKDGMIGFDDYPDDHSLVPSQWCRKLKKRSPCKECGK